MLVMPGSFITHADTRKDRYLHQVDPQAIFELDITRRESYDPGVSSLLRNLTVQPWDGEGQSAYDFAPGGGFNFVGDPGSVDAYFQSTGSMQIPLNGVTPAFFKNLHRTDIQQEVSFVFIWFNPAATTVGQMVFIGNASSNSDNGFDFRVEIGNSKYSFRQRNGSSSAYTSIFGPFNKLDAWNLIIWSFSRQESPVIHRKWANSRDQVELSLTDFNPATEDPLKTLQISGVLTSARFVSGQRLRYAAALGGFMTDQRAEKIIDYLQAQHQFAYV